MLILDFELIMLINHQVLLYDLSIVLIPNQIIQIHKNETLTIKNLQFYRKSLLPYDPEYSQLLTFQVDRDLLALKNIDEF